MPIEFHVIPQNSVFFWFMELHKTDTGEDPEGKRQKDRVRGKKT
jgi:hypothetical protein